MVYIYFMGGIFIMASKGMPHSYEIIGDIAIFELPDGSGPKPMDIARSIRREHPRVRTVLQRLGEREGELRLRRHRTLIGKDTETVYREHGCRFLLDPTKVYFSPREATERERVAAMVKAGETVLVMFAGIGPFGIVIAAKSREVERVYQVEVNPEGYEYMKRSIAMNKLGHKVVPILGDAGKACAELSGRCDRVLMPLPRDSHKYLRSAIRALKKKGTIHFYAVGRQEKGASGRKADEQVYGPSTERLKKAAKDSGARVKVMARRKVLPFSPGAWKICIDAEIRKAI